MRFDVGQEILTLSAGSGGHLYHETRRLREWYQDLDTAAFPFYNCTLTSYTPVGRASKTAPCPRIWPPD
jgi:hypothetical protein